MTEWYLRPLLTFQVVLKQSCGEFFFSIPRCANALGIRTWRSLDDVVVVVSMGEGL